jgi:hypothetical protein
MATRSEKARHGMTFDDLVKDLQDPIYPEECRKQAYALRDGTERPWALGDIETLWPLLKTDAALITHAVNGIERHLRFLVVAVGRVGCDWDCETKYCASCGATMQGGPGPCCSNRKPGECNCSRRTRQRALIAKVWGEA